MNRSGRYNIKENLITLSLIMVNVIVFFYLSFQGMTEDAGFLLQHGAMYVPYFLEKSEYYRIFTSMFLHFGFDHLMNNMIMLAVTGWVLEREIGKVKYLMIYILSGLCGNIASMIVEVKNQDYAVGAGASGAIFGVVGALLFIAIYNRGRVGNLTMRGLVIIIALSLYFGLTTEGVDNICHLGGMLCGFVLAILLYRKRRETFYGGYNYER